MPLGKIQARALPHLSDELFWVQDLNINFRSSVPEARAWSLLSPFWELFWLCFISSRPKRNKTAKGVGTHATLMKKIGRGSRCTALSFLTNLRNFLALFPWEQSVSNLYQWRMMIVCLCAKGADEPTWENAPGRWNIWKWKATSSQTHYFRLLLFFQTLQLIKIKTIFFFQKKKKSMFICCTCLQRSFLCYFCFMLTHHVTAAAPHPHHVAI